VDVVTTDVVRRIFSEIPHEEMVIDPHEIAVEKIGITGGE
jgi:hypothetical protein